MPKLSFQRRMLKSCGIHEYFWHICSAQNVQFYMYVLFTLINAERGFCCLICIRKHPKHVNCSLVGKTFNGSEFGIKQGTNCVFCFKNSWFLLNLTTWLSFNALLNNKLWFSLNILLLELQYFKICIIPGHLPWHDPPSNIIKSTNKYYSKNILFSNVHKLRTQK